MTKKIANINKNNNKKALNLEKLKNDKIHWQNVNNSKQEIIIL